ncbi:MAG: hypothetical protein LBI59_00590 [Candidatus Accumulibacter sp.]|jgi:hypothetical protein|nr:hypothetical protein [Accumulibacter sp.]
MTQLATISPCFPAMSDASVDKVRRLETWLLDLPQVDIPTRHVIHAGMYARTITIPAGTVITGALIKVPTMLVVFGDCTVFVGESSLRLTGHHVVPASAGRKQVFVAFEDTTLTMIFPTQAKTVEEAEAEFTDEFARLLSRHDKNEVVITGE